MGRIVVTEFISLDGVIEAPGGGEDYKYAGWTFEIDRGDEGNQFKLGETKHSGRVATRPADLRGLRCGPAGARWRIRRQVQLDAEVRRVVDAAPLSYDVNR